MNFIAGFFFTVLFLSVAELLLLVRASQAMGFLATLGLCVLTGILGGALVRMQGLQTLNRMQGELAAGRLPADEILEGIALLLVGALLCVPGFLTDAIGGLMLIPGLRRVVVGWIRKKVAARVTFHTMGPGPGFFQANPEIKDVECEEKPPDRE